MNINTIKELKNKYDQYIDFEKYEENPDTYYKIDRYTSLKDMIGYKLNTVLKEKCFSIQMPYVEKYLGVPQNKLEEYLAETIEINAIEQMFFIYQQIDDERKIKKSRYFNFDSGRDANAIIDKIDKRLDIQRGRIQRENYISLSGTEFYMPKVIQAFRDILICRKTNTTSSMISEFYSPILDIFINPEKNHEKYNDFELFLSHRLWDFKLKHIKKLKNIYCVIMNEKNPAKRFCCMMFMEKLYGIFNFCSLLHANPYIYHEPCIITAPAAISLGFTPLHDKLYTCLSQTSEKDIQVFNGILNEFISPVCRECLEYVIASTFLHTDDLMEITDIVYNFCDGSAQMIEKYVKFVYSTQYAATISFKSEHVSCYKNLLYGHETKNSDIIDILDDSEDSKNISANPNTNLRKEIDLYLLNISHDLNVYYDHCYCNDDIEPTRHRAVENEFNVSEIVIDRSFLSLSFKEKIQNYFEI